MSSSSMTLMIRPGCLIAVAAILTEAALAQYVPRSEGLRDPESAIAFVKESADFWKKSHDEDRGGFYTDVNREGNPTKQRKTILTQSRHAFGFAKAFMLTGDESYLDMARSALDFQYAYCWDEANDGWFVEMTEEGELRDSNWNRSRWAFFQDYAMLGPSTMVLAGDAPVDRQWLERGTLANEKRWDSREGFEGYYENADADYGNARGKGFLPTVDALNTYWIRRYQISGSMSDRARMFQLGDQIVNHLVASLDDPTVLFGFAELFDNDWAIDDASTRNNTGHVLKAAWMLAQLYLVSPQESYREGMERLMDEVLNYDSPGHEAWDEVNGAPFGNYNWQTGERGNSDKEWWMLEQAVHAGILAHFITGNERYLQMADESLAFFEAHFVDDTFGEVYAATTAEGEPKSTNKGDFWKAGFHSTELGWFTYLYGRLFYHDETVTLFYRFDPQETARSPILNPLVIEGSRLGIVEVRRAGEPYIDFNPVTRELHLGSQVGGVFEVTFERDPEIPMPLVIEWSPADVVYGDVLSQTHLSPRIVDPTTGLDADANDYHVRISHVGETIQDTSVSDAVQFVELEAGSQTLRVEVILTESGAAKGNLEEAQLEVTQVVLPRPLVARPMVSAIVYGDALPTREDYQIQLEGLPTTISEEAFLAKNLDTTEAMFQLPVGTEKAVGEFEMVLSNIQTSGNVDISYEAGLLEIATAPLTITANAVSRPFGQANPILTATITGWAHGDDASVFTSPLQMDTVAAVDSGVGEYAIVPSGAVSEFYDIDFVPGVLTVVQADQAIDFPEIDVIVLDREPVTVTLSATSSSGLPVTFTLSEGEAALEGNALTISVPGSLVITASQAGDASWNPAADVVRSVEVTGRGVIPDADGDGLPDAFEEKYFADNTSADPDADDDHDLFSNRAEWLFGTSPIDGRSLPMVQFDVSEQLVSIQSIAERRYVLEVSRDLTEFESYGDLQLGTGEVLNFGELPQGNRFQSFRIQVLEE